MALDRRPGRPTTRALSPASSKPPTQRTPAAKSTRRAEARVPTRGIRPASSASSRTPLVVGGAVGGILLLVALAAVLGGGGAPASSPKAPARKASKPVDVTELERNGLAKCEQGLTLIQSSYASGNKTGLQRGVDLIREGNSLLEEANRLSGNKYDTKKFNEALKMARNKILELK